MNPPVSAEIPEIVQPPGGAVICHVTPLNASELPVKPGSTVPFKPQTSSLDTMVIEVTLTGALGGDGTDGGLDDGVVIEGTLKSRPMRITAKTATTMTRTIVEGPGPDRDDGEASGEGVDGGVSASLGGNVSGGGGSVAPHH
jgi:hypothetical protein